MMNAENLENTRESLDLPPLCTVQKHPLVAEGHVINKNHNW